jgi:hypothetical protein
MFDKVKAFVEDNKFALGAAAIAIGVGVTLAFAVGAGYGLVNPMPREVLPKSIFVDFVMQGEKKFMVLNGKLFGPLVE